MKTLYDDKPTTTMSRLVPTDEPETKLSTLNPLFLQSVLDEAAKRQKAGPAEQQTAYPFSAFAINEPKAETDSADQDQPGTFELTLPQAVEFTSNPHGGNVVDTLLPPHGRKSEAKVALGWGREKGSEASDLTRPHPSPPPWGEGTLELNSTVLHPNPPPVGESLRGGRNKELNSAVLPTGEIPTSFGNLAYAKTVFADKRAEIDQAQQQLDRLLKIKAIVEPADLPATGKANLNELKLKRLAIQMALVADSTEYTAQDLQAVDKQIAELSGASSRQPKSPANTTERMKLNANIEELQDKVQVLTEELNRQVADYNLSVAFKKAEGYVQQLKAACNLRHELLALVELLANDHLLMDLRLGGELPMPYGFEPFDSIPEDGLATTLEGIEEAKIRISQELIL